MGERGTPRGGGEKSTAEDFPLTHSPFSITAFNTTPRLSTRRQEPTQRPNRQNESLRGQFLRPEDLPRQGANCRRFDTRQNKSEGEFEADWVTYNRASSTSVVTARSSVSRTASPSRSSCSARTPARSPGPSFTADSTRREFQRSVAPETAHAAHARRRRRIRLCTTCLRPPPPLPGMRNLQEYKEQ